MITEESLKPDLQDNCRICFDEDGHLISLCDCNGSLKYVHPVCIDTWISLTLKTGRLKDTDEGNSKYSVKCELCQGKIIFKKKKHKECLKNVEVKEKIREECGKFIWLLFSVVILTVLIFGVVGLLIRSSSDKVQLD